METEAHSSILAWEIPWIEEPGGLQSMGLQKSQMLLIDSAKTITANTVVEALPIFKPPSYYVSSITIKCITDPAYLV